MLDLHKQDSENTEQFIWRMGQYKDSGAIDLNWAEIAELINKEIGNEDMPFQESAFRKPFQQAKRFYDAGVFGVLGDDEQLEEMKLLKQDLEKERIKTRDERNELRRILREEARKESFRDLVKRTIAENVEPIDILISNSPFGSDSDLLVHCTDLHCGIEIDNWKNVFNEDVLKERIERYSSYIIETGKRHNSKDCYVVVGEIVSGLIHNNLRLQNNMDLMEQFKYASELISAMLVELAKNFNHIYMYTTPGNHSRLSPNKEDSLDNENFDVLLPFYLKAKLQNVENVSICDNEIEPEIAIFDIRNKHIFASHGHKDTPSNVVQNFTMMFGVKPDIVLLGHRHTNGMTTVFDSKVLEAGCVSGSDQFAVSIRKANRPEQTISVIDDTGLVCLYDVQLD